MRYLLPMRGGRAASLRLARWLSAAPRDITGNEVSGTGALQISRRGAAVSVLDEAIMCMISGESSSVSRLRTCLTTEPTNGLANALLAFELLRNCALEPATAIEIESCLSRLESGAHELTERERFFGAAAVQWQLGNYRRAGALLESSTLSSPTGDPIALRLAQDCYLAAGDGKNVLGCVARSLQLSDQASLFHGHLLGMLSVGYLENGRLLDAEETANRSIAHTKGRDVWALNTLMGVFQLTGRSSEILATAEEHLDKHESFGMQSLLFNKGCALTQRGNYRGAARVFDGLVESIETEGVVLGSAVVQATLLLWQISLQTNVKASRWQDLVQLWIQRQPDEKSTITDANLPPLALLSKTLAMTGLAACARVPEESQPGTISLPEGGQIASGGDQTLQPQQSSQGADLLAWLWKPLYANKVVAAGTTETLTKNTVSSQARFTYEELHDKATLHVLHAKEGNSALAPTVDDKATMKRMRLVMPAFQLVTGDPEMSRFLAQTGCSEKDWALITCTSNLQRAFSCFNQSVGGGGVEQEKGEGGVEQTARVLNDLKTVFHRVGGTQVQRDVLSQTLIEAMLRSERWTDVRLLLSERTMLAPNDAQAWRRQASVLGRLGHQDLAAGASYTAWQLGIGQGGFGGPR